MIELHWVVKGCFTIRVHHLSHFWWKMKCFVIPQHAFFCVMNKPYIDYMWCDQAKSVWSRSNSVFIFLNNCMHHFNSYILQKTPLKLVNWFQRYEQLKDAENNRKQKTFSALFGSTLQSTFPTSDWFCLITSHIKLLTYRHNLSWIQLKSKYFVYGLPLTNFRRGQFLTELRHTLFKHMLLKHQYSLGKFIVANE